MRNHFDYLAKGVGQTALGLFGAVAANAPINAETQYVDLQYEPDPARQAGRSRLAGRTYIATDEFTAADILMTHVLDAGSTPTEMLQPYANIVAYVQRCTDRPAWKKSLAVYYERVKPA